MGWGRSHFHQLKTVVMWEGRFYMQRGGMSEGVLGWGSGGALWRMHAPVGKRVVIPLENPEFLVSNKHFFSNHVLRTIAAYDKSRKMVQQ